MAETLDEEQKRVSMQVSSLSTQLIDVVGRLSSVEEQLSHSRRENERLKSQLSESETLSTRYEDLQATYKRVFEENQKLKHQIPKEIKEKEDAKGEVEKLQKEVEELTASLFDEANNMVADANRKAAGVEKRNENLISQLRDKDLLLEDLQSQLRELKDVILDRDEDERQETPVPADSAATSAISNPQQSQSHVLFSPIVTAIRYDLKLFAEFRKFAATIDDPESTTKGKETKFFKKLLVDDIEPALRLDLASGIGWLNKRSLMSAMIEGRVVIEPVSGVNETYRLSSQKRHSSNQIPTLTASSPEGEVIHSNEVVHSNLYAYPSSSPPIAINSPCSVCTESRDDILEHSRLYTLKFTPKETLTTTLSTNTHNVYPLCSYCLFRVRSTCDIFAFLRSLKTDIWNLKDEVILRKAWIELSRLRSRLFWSKVGIWDTEKNIVTTKITPGFEDHVYHAVKGQSDPASQLTADQFGSTESLTDGANDSALNTPEVEYKASPLCQEITEKKLASGAEQEPLTRTTDVSKEVEPDTDASDAANDILDGYAEEEEDTKIEEPTSKLSTKDENENESEETPVSNQILESTSEVKVKAQSVVSPEQEFTFDETVKEADNELEANVSGESKDSDEDNFVDA